MSAEARTIEKLAKLLTQARRGIECHAMECALCRELLPEIDTAVRKAGFDPQTSERLDLLLRSTRAPEGAA